MFNVYLAKTGQNTFPPSVPQNFQGNTQINEG